MSGDEVRGGVGGVTARYDDMLALGRLFGDSGDVVSGVAVEVGEIAARLSGDTELIVASALSPGTAAEAVAGLAAAEAGPHGLVRAASDLEADALHLRLAVETYRTADRALADAAHLLDDAAGWTLGAALPVIATAPLTTPFLVLPLVLFPDGRRAALAGAQQLLIDHPGVAEHLLDGAPGLENGLLAWLGPAALPLLVGSGHYPTTYTQAVGNVGLFFRDGDPAIGPAGPELDQDRRPPHSVRDLLEGVQRRQDRPDPKNPDGKAVPGEIGIKQLITADGRSRYIVELPGTEVWPLTAGPNARDTATNVHTMAGHDTVYMRGIEAALKQAGVPAGADLMLVGHSQGGMTAAALAADPSFRAQYRVTHVLTAGAPIARDQIPPQVQVLALENRNDLVPRLDGAPNPDRPNITTVVIDHNQHDVGRNHSLVNYARDADQIPTTNPSVAAWLGSATRDGYLVGDGGGTSGVHVVNQRFAITRKG